MGRSKLLSLLAVCALTLLNIWMAKYVVRPLKESARWQQVDAVKDRQLSDVLIVAVDDIHPMQHLQEATAMEVKQQSTTTSSFHLTLGTTYQSRIVEFTRDIDQAVDRNSRNVADNNWKYGNGALGDKRSSSGHLENPENNIANDNVNTANSIVVDNLKPENNAADGNADKVINNNVNIEIPNYRNIYLPYSNISHSSYQSANRRHNHELTDLDKQNGVLQASDSDTWSNYLKSVDTAELVNIKQSLEHLKYLLGKFTPNSKQTVLERPLSADTLRRAQPAGKPDKTLFGDNNEEGSQPGRVPVQTRSPVSPLEYYLLGSSTTGSKPPEMAAPASPLHLFVSLLTSLLNESNADRLNAIIEKNADAVRYVLQGLLYSQRPPQGAEYHQQQQKSDLITAGQSESSAGTSQVQSPDVPALDYNRKAIKEMIRNIAKYNKVQTSVDREQLVGNFIRNIQAGH